MLPLTDCEEFFSNSAPKQTLFYSINGSENAALSFCRVVIGCFLQPCSGGGLGQEVIPGIFGPDRLTTQPVGSQGTILAASFIVRATKESHVSGSLLRVVNN